MKQNIGQKQTPHLLLSSPTNSDNLSNFSLSFLGTSWIREIQIKLYNSLNFHKNCRQISLPTLSDFKQFNPLLLPLNSSENSEKE